MNVLEAFEKQILSVMYYTNKRLKTGILTNTKIDSPL